MMDRAAFVPGNLFQKLIPALPISLAVCLCLTIIPATALPAALRVITIVHTNNVTGHLFPCPT